LGDRRKDGERNLNSGDGTGKMAQPWMFMMMMIIKYFIKPYFLSHIFKTNSCTLFLKFTLLKTQSLL
jgi:hypothetical protein